VFRLFGARLFRAHQLILTFSGITGNDITFETIASLRSTGKLKVTELQFRRGPILRQSGGRVGFVKRNLDGRSGGKRCAVKEEPCTWAFKTLVEAEF
jgi:hypothetical protein